MDDTAFENWQVASRLRDVVAIADLVRTSRKEEARRVKLPSEAITGCTILTFNPGFWGDLRTTLSFCVTGAPPTSKATFPLHRL